MRRRGGTVWAREKRLKKCISVLAEGFGEAQYGRESISVLAEGSGEAQYGRETREVEK